MDIDGLLNGVWTVHRVGQDEDVSDRYIEELRSGYAAFIELTYSLRQVTIACHGTVSDSQENCITGTRQVDYII